MKYIFIITLIALSHFSYSQNSEYAEIEFLPYYPYNAKAGINDFKNLSFRIYLNEKLISTINGDEKLNYKIFSKGRVNIVILVGSKRKTGLIDIKENKKYHFIVGFTKNEKSYEEIDKNEADLIKSNWVYQNTLSEEENKNDPIVTEKKNKQTGPSQGTGFLINKNGYILTNHHVIENAKTITITGIKGDFTVPFTAKVVASDRLNDLALLKIESKLVTFETPPYTLSNSKEVKKAERIFALGYPMQNFMGSEVKVTDGIINSLTGFQQSISEFQISAALQEGNSGGPLFNSNGMLIGIVSAKIRSDVADQVGYSIKSNYIKYFLEESGITQFSKTTNTLEGKSLSEQVQILSNFVYIIKTE